MAPQNSRDWNGPHPEGAPEGASGAPVGRSPALGRLLRRLIRREIRVPALVALGALAAAALTKNLLGYADLVINRGLGLGQVGWIALYEVVPVLAATLPFAAGIGILMGLGRLRADQELLAMETTGIAPVRLLTPIAQTAAMAAVVCALLTLFAAPAARSSLRASLERMAAESPGARLRSGVVETFGDRQLLAREVSADGRTLRGVLLWIPENGFAVFSRDGSLEPLEQDGARVTLEEAVVLAPPDQGSGDAEVGRLVADLRRPAPEQLEALGVPALSVGALREQARSASGNEARLALAELHRRFAHPLAVLLFAAVALPLTFTRGRGSRAGAAVLGIVLTVAYYGLVQLGEGLLRFEGFPVAGAIWLPNAASALLAGFLLIRLGGHREERVRRHRVTREGRRSASAPRLVLDRYVSSLYLRTALAGFAVLLAAYLIIDVLERLEWFARWGATPAEIAEFYLARTPLLASRVIPMGLLAGAGLAVSRLALRGELVAMEACGVRLERALAPMALLALLLAPADFALKDVVVTRTNALADRVKVLKIKDGAPSSSQTWVRADDQVVRVSRRELARGRLRDLTLYELQADGLPAARIHAAEAIHEGGGRWRLVDAERVVISWEGFERDEAPEFVRLGEGGAASLDPMHLSVGALRAEITSAREDGYDTTAWQVDLQQKLAAPLAGPLLALFGVIAAVRQSRRPSAARTLLVCAILGVGYVLLVDVAASLGYGGTLSPWVAGWAPPILVAAIAAAVGLRFRPD